jgi:hypothetical protein
MNYDIVGIVVNPKIKKPVLVMWDGEDEIEIWSMERDGQRLGLGSYEKYDETYLQPSYITGMPRVHTPSGVAVKGKGYGTTLYTGLCVGAHQHHENELSLGVDYDGDGISSSSDTRSSSASKWWDMAVRLGLAAEVEDEHVDEDVEFESGDLSCTHYDGEQVEVDWARGSITRYISANVYEFDKAEDADLVVAVLEGISIPGSSLVEVVRSGEGQAELSTGREQYGDRRIRYYIPSGGYRNIWKKLAEHDDASYVNRDALLALDVRNLEPQAVNLLSTIAMIDGVDDEDIDAMRMRAEQNLDPDTPIKQMRLQFKKNPSDVPELKAALQETKELRASLDWKRLSALP